MNDSSASEFDVQNAFLFRVKEGLVEWESFGDYSIHAILDIIPRIKIGEILLIVRGALDIQYRKPEIVDVAMILVHREGAYVIKPEGQLYEEVIDGYNFGFLPLNIARGLVGAVLAGDPDPTYLLYENTKSRESSDDSYTLPPCYT